MTGIMARVCGNILDSFIPVSLSFVVVWFVTDGNDVIVGVADDPIVICHNRASVSDINKTYINTEQFIQLLKDEQETFIRF